MTTSISRRMFSASLLAPATAFAFGEASQTLGYPRPLMFRSNTPENIKAAGFRIGMVISDQFISDRRYSDETFKVSYPDRPVIIHVGGAYISANAYTSLQMMEDRGLLESELAATFINEHGGYKEMLSPDFVPMPDFLGYWLYEPGQSAREAILPQQVVEIAVEDPTRFEPVVASPPASKALLQRLQGTTTTPRVVLLCPRDAGGKPDWVHGELGEVVSTHTANKTITVRRFKTSRGWPALPAGTHLASNAARYNRDDLWGMKHTPEGHPYHTPLWPWMMPNFTPLCPVDPRNGLNAVQWFARHFIERKKKYYPHCDGYALDVTTATFIPNTGFIDNVDCDNDGVADMGQIGGVNYWALGMNDFAYYMRNGLPEKFEGLGNRLLLTWDSDSTDEQRFFHLINGGEYEFGMIRDTGLFSSNLDRLLLWFERGQSPNLTFVSDKLPNPIYHRGRVEDIPDEPGYRVGDWRLNAACAVMGTGYIHSDASRGEPKVIGFPALVEERKRYGGSPLPLDYDEYHRGKDGVYGWLGRPIGSPLRYAGHLGAPLYRYAISAPLPRIVARDARWSGTCERVGSQGMRFHVAAAGPYYATQQKFTLLAQIPLVGVDFREHAEYALRFRARGSSPFAGIAERYRPIPRGISIRLRVNDSVGGATGARSQRSAGNVQDLLLFEQDRPIDVTVVSPSTGAGVLEICLTESPGSIEVSEFELRQGSGDVLYRKFEHGLVVLNGAKDSAVEIPMAAMFPGETYRRLDGTQDPRHNNGQRVSGRLEVPAHDAFFLVKE